MANSADAVTPAPAAAPTSTPAPAAAPKATPVHATIIEDEPAVPAAEPTSTPKAAAHTQSSPSSIVVRRRGRLGTGLALIGLGLKTLITGKTK